MKTTLEDIINGMEEKHGNLREIPPQGLVMLGFRELAEQERPHLEKRLKRFEGKKFTTLGKLELLEDLECMEGEKE